MSSLSARAVVRGAAKASGVEPGVLDLSDLDESFVGNLCSALALYGVQEARILEIRDRVSAMGQITAPPKPSQAAGTPLLVRRLEAESDVVSLRGRVRQIAQELGFGNTDEVKIATAVSEIARNVVTYAGAGEVRVERLAGARSGLRITVRDRGPGIPHLDAVLDGTHRSETGMGLGIRGSRRLMDTFEVHTDGHGTCVTMQKWLPEARRRGEDTRSGRTRRRSRPSRS